QLRDRRGDFSMEGGPAPLLGLDRVRQAFLLGRAGKAIGPDVPDIGAVVGVVVQDRIKPAVDSLLVVLAPGKIVDLILERRCWAIRLVPEGDFVGPASLHREWRGRGLWSLGERGDQAEDEDRRDH